MVNWQEVGNPFSRKTSLFKDFTEEITQEWINAGFDKTKTREWLESGLQPNEAGFAQWLSVIKNQKPEQLPSYDEIQELREEYREFLEEVESGSKLSTEVIRKIKSFHDFVNSEIPNNYRDLLTKEQKDTVEKLISSQELKEQLLHYGLCRICYQPNIGRHIFTDGIQYFFCQYCNDEAFFQKKVKKLASGNQVIDDFINEWQLKSKKRKEVLEWIPYEQFEDIEHIADGGFGKVFKAKWANRPILGWGGAGNKNLGLGIKKDKKWWWIKTDRWAVLKVLNDSQKISKEFLHEIACHKLVDDNKWIVKCYGISQEPSSKNYVIVMEYIVHGDLRKYLKSYPHQGPLSFEGKINQLENIISGLNSIHKKGLIHRDLHSGNILNRHITCFITDLGLCRPADETDKSKVFGVLSYVAPEVLTEKKYTQAADIYSFGIIATEILTALPPYSVYDERENSYKEIFHNADLASAICQGLRPKFQVKIPQLLEDLIKKCWDADPAKRPTANEVLNNLLSWCEGDENSEFGQQAKKAEEFNLTLPEHVKNPNYKEHHPEAVRRSKALDFENLPKPQNSQEAEEVLSHSGEINKEINEIKSKISLLKKPLDDELTQLVEKFVETKKKSIKDEKDERARNETKELNKKLREKGFPREKIGEIIRCCEKLVNLEQQTKEVELQTEAKIIEAPPKNNY